MSSVVNYPTCSVEEFIELLASKESVPGGGTLTAVVIAQAIAMAEMVCNFTLGKKSFEAVEQDINDAMDKFGRLKKRALELSILDSEIYLESKPYFSGKGHSAEDVENALINSNKSPLEMLEIAKQAGEIVEGLADKTNKNLSSDLNIATHLLTSTKTCCIETININLKYIKNEDYITQTKAAIR